MPFVLALQPQAESPAGGTLWFAIGKRGLLVRRDGSGGREQWALPDEAAVRGLGIPCDERTFFGRLGDRDVFASSLEDKTPLPEGWSLLGLRDLVQAFDEETFAIAGHASHVLDWATTSRFCGRCGARTERVPTEWCMRCSTCSLMIYPRIAPAVIVLIRRGDHALLARNARFPLPMYSTLAGFSNIGETLEETLRREVFEEVGVRVGALRYFGSQPWPFPNSLMVAFTAEWESGEIAVDHEEIADAVWASVDALPLIPPRISIARRMIDAWALEVRSRG
jgi:NAD+ diphosphatase